MARDARVGCVHEVVRVIRVSHVDVNAVVDHKLVQVVFVPTENTEDNTGQLLKAALVRNVEDTLPTSLRRRSRFIWVESMLVGVVFEAKPEDLGDAPRVGGGGDYLNIVRLRDGGRHGRGSIMPSRTERCPHLCFSVATAR